MKKWLPLLVLLSAGLALRAGLFILFSNDLVVGSDQMQNILLSRKIAAGDLLGSLDTYWAPLYAIVVGGVNVIVDDLVLPAVIVSIVSGGLLVVFTYALTLQSYGRKVAVLAAAVAVFFPHLINSVFSLGSENLYMLWVVGALTIGWRGIANSSIVYMFLTGLLIGLAYLTRPEAFGYLLFFVGVAIVNRLRSASNKWIDAGRQAIAVLAGFLLLSAPYLLFLRYEVGHWTLSAKSEVNTIASEYRSLAKAEGVESIEVSSESKSYSVILFARIIAENLVQTNKSLQVLIPLFLIALIGLGLFGTAWSAVRFWREAYLISFCALTIAGYSVAVIQVRYFYVLLPVIFGWLAVGILKLQSQLAETARRVGYQSLYSYFASRVFTGLMLFGVFVYTFPLYFFVISEDRAWSERAYEERDAGLWLREHGRPLPKIFSGRTTPVFYANGRQLPPKTTNIDEIMSTLMSQDVDYVVTSERALKRNPFLRSLPDALHDSGKFDLIYDFHKPPGYRVSIYERRIE